MASYLTGVDTTVHPEDEMLLNAMAGIPNKGLARAVYFRQGHEINSTLQELLDWACAGDKRNAKVLEFACGYGRATRFLVAQVNPRNVWASDIYAGAVEFQRKQFGVNGFVSCHEPSELACDETFDLIFVASLFTHLPRHRFEQWLARLFQMLSPRGVLAFSVHDETLVAGRAMPEDGYLFVKASESRSLDLDEYGSTYVTEGYMSGAIARVIGAGAHWHYKRLPLALCGAHDMYLVARDPTQDFSTLVHVQPPVGYVERFGVTPGGALTVAGWAAEHDLTERVENISVSVDGRVRATARPDIDRPDVVQVLGKASFLRSGWLVSLRNLPPSRHGSKAVEVTVTSSSGRSAILHSSALSDAAMEPEPPAAPGLVSRVLTALRKPA